MRILFFVSVFITLFLVGGCKKKPLVSIPESVKKDRFEAEISKSKTVHKVESFDGVEVQGYLDNPTPMVITDSDSKSFGGDVVRKVDSSPTKYSVNSSPVKAAAHDDNEEFAYYQTYLNGARFSQILPWNVSNRLYLRAVDSKNLSLFGEEISILNANNEQIFHASLPASGEVVVFPKMDFTDSSIDLKSCKILLGNSGNPVSLEQKDLRTVLSVAKDTPRTLPQKTVVQIAFVVDATGSMGDEIKRLQDAVYTIHHRLTSLNQNVEFQFSVVAYRDRGDDYVVAGEDFTTSIDTFQMNLMNIEAGGGGDTPEDLDSALVYARNSLNWTKESIKSLFVITDAEPRFEKRNNTYLQAAREFRAMGAKVSTIGASGLGGSAEYALRQISLLTKGEFIFLNYGETGESSGAGTFDDPGKVSHHTGGNYSTRNLDDIVVDQIVSDLSFIQPVQSVVTVQPKPEVQKELLDTRCDNLIQQLFASTPAMDSQTIVLTPTESADSTLRELSSYIWNTALVQIPAYTRGIIIERSAMDKILQEQTLSVTGATKDDGYQRVGELLNADYLILSSIQLLGNGRYCNMRLVNCKTGVVASAARVKL